MSITGISSKLSQLHEFSGVFRGRELTRKDRRLGSNLLPLNDLLGGGIPRGRISEIVGPRSSGKSSIAASFIASATRRGETVAVVDLENAFDPLTMAAAGIDLNRVLWTAFHPDGGIPCRRLASQIDRVARVRGEQSPLVAWKNAVKAAEMILEAGGFGLLVLDFGGYARSIPQSAALRLARLAERSGTSVLVLAPHRMCGTFAALGLALSRSSALFDNSGQPDQRERSGNKASARFDPPAWNAAVLYDGLEIEAFLSRNKLGGSGGRERWRTLIDPPIAPVASSPNRKTQPSGRTTSL